MKYSHDERSLLDEFVTWAEVDLDAIAANVHSFQNHVGKDVEIIAVVKANAYGHGAVAVARAALAAGATRLAVHRAIEGVEIRKAGIDAPVLIMGYSTPAAAALIVQWKLTSSLTTLEFGQALSQQAAHMNTQAPVHIKVDTGMSRYGIMPAEALRFTRRVREIPHIKIEGLFTHFATADALDQTHARNQLNVFKQALNSLEADGLRFPLVHAANSAAAMCLPESHFNAIRPGISMYGLLPSNEWPSPFPLHPALSFKSRVARVRTLPAGAGISYGRTYVTSKPTTVALVPAGYGDGYHRLLSNQGSVLIGGQRAPILGRVCMDQFVVDISQVQGVKMDDEVVLIGRQGSSEIHAEEVASFAETINYEVTTSLLQRVPRVYVQGGEIIEITGLGLA